MSRQLTLSTLLSAFALVSLTLFARAGDMGGAGEALVASQGLIVQVVSPDQ